MLRKLSLELMHCQAVHFSSTKHVVNSEEIGVFGMFCSSQNVEQNSRKLIENDVKVDGVGNIISEIYL